MAAARLPARRDPENSQLSADSDRANLILDMVVIGRQCAVAQVTGERRPAIQAAIERFDDRRSIGHFQPVRNYPSVHGIGNGLGLDPSNLAPGNATLQDIVTRAVTGAGSLKSSIEPFQQPSGIRWMICCKPRRAAAVSPNRGTNLDVVFARQGSV